MRSNEVSTIGRNSLRNRRNKMGSCERNTVRTENKESKKKKQNMPSCSESIKENKKRKNEKMNKKKNGSSLYSLPSLSAYGNVHDIFRE